MSQVMQRDLKCTVYQDSNYYLDQHGYYTKTRPYKALHREVWKEANGDIPEGSVVHHIDHDKGNNNLSNLKVMTLGEHTLHHSNSNPKPYTKRKKVVKECRQCGIEFITFYSKSCSDKCRNLYNYHKGKEI